MTSIVVNLSTVLWNDRISLIYFLNEYNETYIFRADIVVVSHVIVEIYYCSRQNASFSRVINSQLKTDI